MCVSTSESDFSNQYRLETLLLPVGYMLNDIRLPYSQK